MVNFNGIDFPEYVVVGKISNSILPPISQNKIKISKRAGHTSFGNEIGSRSIEMEITILGDNLNDLADKVRFFAEYLYHGEAKKLVIDETGVYYLAQIVDSTDFTTIQDAGQGTLNFICDDPYAYSIDETIANINPIASSSPMKVYNMGQLDAHPQMEFTFSAPVTNFNIVTKNEAMTFGQSNAEKTPKDLNPLVFHDDMSSSAGWATANYVESGIATSNAFTSNGWSVSSANHGEGIQWHGPAGVKSIGTQLQDFKIGCEFGLNPYVGQIGRVQVYGLDINGNVICMLSTKNADTTSPRPEAQVKINNKFYIEQYLTDISKYYSSKGVLLPLITGVTLLKRGDTGASVTKLQTSLKTLGFTVVVDGTFGLDTENVVKQYQTKTGIKSDGIAGKDTLANIQNSLSKIGKPVKKGRMDIARRGSKWSVYYAVEDNKGVLQTQILKTFSIENGGYEMNKLAQIQIHIGAWKDAETYPVVIEAWIGDIKVWDESATLGVNEIPIIFKAGDKLIVDSAADGIFLNGKPYFNTMDASSQFPILNKGENGIIISPPSSIADGTIKFRKRFW